VFEKIEHIQCNDAIESSSSSSINKQLAKRHSVSFRWKIHRVHTCCTLPMVHTSNAESALYLWH